MTIAGIAGSLAQTPAGALAMCIVATQLVMMPVAILSASQADRWGRKPSFCRCQYPPQ